MLPPFGSSEPCEIAVLRSVYFPFQGCFIKAYTPFFKKDYNWFWPVVPLLNNVCYFASLQAALPRNQDFLLVKYFLTFLTLSRRSKSVFTKQKYLLIDKSFCMTTDPRFCFLLGRQILHICLNKKMLFYLAYRRKKLVELINLKVESYAEEFYLRLRLRLPVLEQVLEHNFCV